MFLTCCCVAAGCQGFGLSRRGAAALPPLHLCPLSSLLSSVTGAAGGRWWVLCSLATPLVDGDWYAALFECLSLRAREGDAWTKQALLKLPLLLLFAQARQRGRTNISAQRNRDSNLQQRPWKCNSGGRRHLWRASRCPQKNECIRPPQYSMEKFYCVTNFFSGNQQVIPSTAALEDFFLHSGSLTIISCVLCVVLEHLLLLVWMRFLWFWNVARCCLSKKPEIRCAANNKIKSPHTLPFWRNILWKYSCFPLSDKTMDRCSSLRFAFVNRRWTDERNIQKKLQIKRKKEKEKILTPILKLIKSEYLFEISSSSSQQQLSVGTKPVFWSQSTEHEPALAQPQLSGLAQVSGSSGLRISSF